MNNVAPLAGGRGARCHRRLQVQLSSLLHGSLHLLCVPLLSGIYFVVLSHAVGLCPNANSFSSQIYKESIIVSTQPLACSPFPPQALLVHLSRTLSFVSLFSANPGSCLVGIIGIISKYAGVSTCAESVSGLITFPALMPEQTVSNTSFRSVHLADLLHSPPRA